MVGLIIKEGEPMNISSIITVNASFRPDYRALICGDDGREFTWSEFDDIVNRLGNAFLKLGVQKGELVAIFLPNSPEFLFAYFAIARIGAIALPFNILFRTPEISYICNDSQARFFIGSASETRERVVEERDRFTHLEQIITVGEKVEGCIDFYEFIAGESEQLTPVKCGLDEIAMMLYTSGTTGRPKGAMLSYNNLLSIGTVSASVLHINDRDLLLTGAPYCHIFFVLTVLGTFKAGATLVTSRRFDAIKTLELIDAYQITHYAGVPTMLILLLEKYPGRKYNLKSWRYVFCAGAAMPVGYIDQIEEMFDVDYIEMYGATETSSVVTYNRLGHTRKGSVGQVAFGNQVIIADDEGTPLGLEEVGEVLIKGPGIFKAYWHLPEASQAAFINGWYRSGDMGRMDKDGYLYLLDRKKDVIISGGYNIYPGEVEAVIMEHPKIKEVAVVGIKDPLWDQVAKAYVVLREGEELDPEEFTAFCKANMANYKVPRLVEFIPELPKSPTGKILKRLLIED